MEMTEDEIERAAIREYEAGQDRESADRDARRELLECEARELLSWDKPKRQQFLRDAEKHRGPEAIQRLKDEIMRQWRASA